MPVSSKSKPRPSGPVLRSLSPSGRFCSSSSSSASSSSLFASSTSYSFYSSSSAALHNHYEVPSHHLHRSSSPTRVNVYSSTALTPSVRFSIDHRSISPNRSISVSKHKPPVSFPKRTCMCSPTTHPGSFRCSLHKNKLSNGAQNQAASFPSSRLIMWRSAMTNSLVRIGGVEGEWVRRALTTLIRPSSHQLRRRSAFQPRPSRLSVMSKADDI